MSLLHVISYSDGRQDIKWDYEVKDGCVKVRVYDPEDEYGDNYYHENVPVEIDRSYLVEVNAKFIMNPCDKYKSPMYIRMGGFEINHLAYTYSVVIIEHFGSWNVYDSSIKHSECGIGTTNFPMYSYHTKNDKDQTVYSNDQIAYEATQNINFRKILLNDHE